MNYYDAFLGLLLLIKVALVVSSILVRLNIDVQVTAEVLTISKNAFDILMCLLLMFLFNPFYTKLHKINYETCVFIFVFAVLTMVHTAVELYPKKS
jgi:hypothetical protein